MNLKRKLYTTDPSFKLHTSFARINAVQALAKGLTHGTTIVEYIDLKTIPTKKHESGRNIIDWSWFRKILTAHAQGFTSVGLHLRPKDRVKFRLASTIKGAYRNTARTPIEWYVIASTAKELERRIGHEEGHGFEDLGHLDTTGLTKRQASNPLHYYATKGDLSGFYRRITIS